MATLSAHPLVKFVIAVCGIAEVYFEKVSLWKKVAKAESNTVPNTFKLHFPTPT